MTYTPRWAATSSIVTRGFDQSVPWLDALERARGEAAKAARDRVFADHFEDFLRHFDIEMDERHAAIVAEYAEQLEVLRNSPEFWLQPDAPLPEAAATPDPNA